MRNFTYKYNNDEISRHASALIIYYNRAYVKATLMDAGNFFQILYNARQKR